MIGPIRRSVTVAVDPERAFRAFTRDLATWWPVDTHSMAAERDDGSRVVSIVVEEREAGRVYEVDDRGGEGTWATIDVWDPPRRLVLSWKPNLRDEPPTEVEVRFVPLDGGTRVELEHRGWERLGPRAAEAARSYATGWGTVLAERYARAAVTTGA
jgi:uncharacterized protein YndB with AHSA1/START domain